MRIWLNPARMAAHNITTQDIEQALRSQNIELPSGRIESAEREFSITAHTDLSSPEEFGNVVLRYDDGYPIQIKDIARVELNIANADTDLRLPGG